MRLLVTGGLGFIGSNLVDALIDQDHEVAIIDNLITGQKANLNPQATWHEIDIANHEAVAKVFSEFKPEAIFHLAAQIDVRKSVADPVFDANTNILATVNLIELAKKHGIQKFIFSSSGGAAYGEADIIPTPEGTREQPLSPYGIGKATIDQYLYAYNHTFGLNYTSLRYANVYGPRQNSKGEAGVIAIFIDKMLQEETPTINGDGTQTRDYVFVGDVVAANLAALSHLEKIGIFNVGTGREISVKEIFQNINQLFGNRFEEKHGAGKKGEQMRSCLDNTKIKRELGWEPKVNFEEGVKKTWEWYNNKK